MEIDTSQETLHALAINDSFNNEDEEKLKTCRYLWNARKEIGEGRWISWCEENIKRPRSTIYRRCQIEVPEWFLILTKTEPRVEVTQGEKIVKKEKELEQMTKSGVSNQHLEEKRQTIEKLKVQAEELKAQNDKQEELAKAAARRVIIAAQVREAVEREKIAKEYLSKAKKEEIDRLVKELAEAEARKQAYEKAKAPPNAEFEDLLRSMRAIKEDNVIVQAVRGILSDKNPLGRSMLKKCLNSMYHPDQGRVKKDGSLLASINNEFTKLELK